MFIDIASFCEWLEITFATVARNDELFLLQFFYHYGEMGIKMQLESHVRVYMEIYGNIWNLTGVLIYIDEVARI